MYVKIAFFCNYLTKLLKTITKYYILYCREYIVYIVPILMLLFIGSLVVALICVRVRNCDFEALHFNGRPTIPTTTTNSNGNLRVEIPSGEMVIMTELDMVDPDATASQHSGGF